MQQSMQQPMQQPMQFDRVLIANRGEIAWRVIRGCRALGLSTVAVYSDPDADLLHVREADLAVHIGPAPAAESYLRIDAIIDAAKRTGAQAIHPGYGFLSENAAFAEACEAAGIVFVGPTAESIRQMGSKARARELMAARGVPVVPGYGGADQSDATLSAVAEEIGFPVMVKAAAGGGGKGMSVVRAAADLPAALAGARRLARSAFGDDTLVVERYLEGPRHVEVQILGDGQGGVVHFFERECSIQRRFQKIIEEAPSPALDEDTRQALCEAGVAAGKAINYRGAGTVEFILDNQGRFYFLEVNTRLQVEHRITEEITGEDLVAWQLRIAAGEGLPDQASITRRGHAIECRLYAEDPASDFLPSAGPLTLFEAPCIDRGYRQGDVIGIHYDPLIAKLVTHGADRASALRQMRARLGATVVAGVVTNRDFMIDVLKHPAFAAGDFDTHFISTQFAGWQPQVAPDALIRRLVAATLAEVRPTAVLPGLRTGFRNNRGAWQTRVWQVGEECHSVAYQDLGGGAFAVRIADTEHAARIELTQTAQRGRLIIDGLSLAVELRAAGDLRVVLDVDGSTALTAVPRFPEAEADDASGGLIAPMPGKVVAVETEPGATVSKGQVLVILEAMKMEQSLTAPRDGVVEQVRCTAGDLVEAGAALVVLAED